MSKKKNALLWKIEHAKYPTSYLFGTMHVRDSRAFSQQPLIEEKIKSCDVYAAEMNLDEVNQDAMSTRMDLEDDLRLQDLLKPKIYKRLEKLFLKQTGFPLLYFERSQPILITNLITETILSRDAPLSLDATLWHFAKEEGKVLIGIESFGEQLQILDQIPLKYQVKGIEEMVRKFKKYKKQLIQLTELYQKGDIQQLYKKTKKQAGGLRKLMIYDRNHRMAERIATLVKEQSIFVAVGAGHLSGAKGIIRLLKIAGFRCQPVREAFASSE